MHESDVETLARHRTIWAARPELREVYQEWFRMLLDEVAGLTPVVEVGTGPGFFKEFAPRLVSTDVVRGPFVDVCCDAGQLPFRTGRLGALVMVDALHHLPRPLAFLEEAARVLKPGGRLAMLEPWITPASFFLYRYLHHEGCRLGVNLERPFEGEAKRALDGNPAIPSVLFRRLRGHAHSLRLRHARTFVGLPYLFTFGFQRARPLPAAWMRLARAAERLTPPVTKLAASRVLAVWERMADGAAA